MSVRNRMLALVVILVSVELPALTKLSHYLGWSTEAWQAPIQALGFLALLLGSIIALGSDLSEQTEKQFRIGGIVLFSIQALGNCLVSYEYARTHLPTDVVIGFFPFLTPEWAVRSTAIIAGAALSIVSLAFWSALGEMLKAHLQERHSQRAHQASALKEINEILEGTSR